VNLNDFTQDITIKKRKHKVIEGVMKLTFLAIPAVAATCITLTVLA